MASVYKKRNRIFISWYDSHLGKNVNKSTGLEFNRTNLKKAKEMAAAIEEKLQEERNHYKRFGIKKLTIEKAKEHFLDNNADKHKNTIKGYELFFERFSKSFPLDLSCSTINKISIESWINKIKKLKLQRNTIYGIVKNLKKFLNFMFEYNYIPHFIINKDVLVRPEVKEIITFTNNDLRKLIDNLESKNENFVTMIYLLLYTGLRPTDIIDIRVEDIDFENSLLRYYSQKTKNYFVVPIHPELIPTLKSRCDQIKDGRLLNYCGAKEMGKALRRYLEKIDLDGKSYNLRTFRKTFISLAYDSDIDLAIVSKLVGHSNISTTAKFYNKIMISRQSEQLNKFKLPLKQEIPSNKNAEVETEVEE